MGVNLPHAAVARKIQGMSEQQTAKSRWMVSGAKSDTGENVTLFVEARSRESAERFVAKSGVLVSSVEPEPVPYAATAAEPGPTVVYVDDVSRGGAFTFGFYAFFGAFAAYLIVAAVVAAVLLAIGVITLHGR